MTISTVSIATQDETTYETNSNFYMDASAKRSGKMQLIYGALIGGAAVCAFYNRGAIKNISILRTSVNFILPVADHLPSLYILWLTLRVYVLESNTRALQEQLNSKDI